MFYQVLITNSINTQSKNHEKIIDITNREVIPPMPYILKFLNEYIVEYM